MVGGPSVRCYFEKKPSGKALYPCFYWRQIIIKVYEHYIHTTCHHVLPLLRYHRHYLFRDVVPYTILASHCLQVLSSQTRKQPYKTHEKFMSVKNKKIVNVTKSIGSILKIARNAKVLQRNRNMRRCTYVCSGMIFIFQNMEQFMFSSLSWTSILA